MNCPHCGETTDLPPDCRCPGCDRVLLEEFASDETVALGSIDSAHVDAMLRDVEDESPLSSARLSPARSARYRMLDEIGSGGMGTVVEAVDQELRRPVAMKVLRDGASRSQKKRFIEEARLTGLLEHPNIVPVHEFGYDENGDPFFTMKKVQGRSLETLLEEIRSDPRRDTDLRLTELLDIMVDVCHAVEFAHDRGVVHRDLKPGNIMLGSFGEVLVMDWGLSRRRSSDVMESAESGAGSDQLGPVMPADQTLDGHVKGTPAYMAPEQAEGRVRDIDERTDIYALGGIIYEMLTLHEPVEGDTLQEVLANVKAHRIREPHLRAPERRIPRDLAAIAMKALSRSRALRYQSVRALRQDIQLFASGHTVTAKPDSPIERTWKFIKRNRTLSASAAVILILTVVFGVLNSRERAKASEANRDKEQLEEQLGATRKEQEREERRIWIEVYNEPMSLDRIENDWLVLDGWGPSATKEPLRPNQLDNEMRSVHDGVLLNADDVLTLLSRKRYRGDLRLVYEVTWLGGDEGGFHGILGGNGYDEGYIFQLGGFGNNRAMIMRQEAGHTRVLAETPWSAREGTRYVIEAERIDRRLTLRVNGEELLNTLDDGPPLLGERHERIGMFSNFYSEVVLHRMAAWQYGPPPKEDLLDAAERYMGLGKYRTARDIYQDVLQVSHDERRIAQAQAGIEAATSQIGALAQLSRTTRLLRRSDFEPDSYSVDLAAGGLRMRLDVSGRSDLEPLADIRGVTDLELNGAGSITDYSAIANLPLRTLRISSYARTDLEPFADMPLSVLDLAGANKLSDIGVLAGKDLTLVDLSRSAVSDISPLTAAKNLHTVNLSGTRVEDLTPLAGKPLANVNLDGCDQLLGLEPLAGAPLRDLHFSGLPLTDLAVLANMPLVNLRIEDCPQLTDLSHVETMALDTLTIESCGLADLFYLAKTTLKHLRLNDLAITDIDPIGHLPIKRLSLADCSQVRDVSILGDMALKELDLSGTAVSDLEPLRGLRLIRFTGRGLPIDRPGALAGMPLQVCDLRQVDLVTLGAMLNAPPPRLLLDGHLLPPEEQQLLEIIFREQPRRLRELGLIGSQP